MSKDNHKITNNTASNNLFLIVMAVVIGIFSGLITVLFARSIDLLSQILFMKYISTGYIILLPAVGGLAAGLVVQYGSETARGHGVPSILMSIKSKDTKLSVRDLFTEGLASIITISSGGSAGRIGPVIEIGAGVGDILGHRFNLPLNIYQTILGCGAAAGIAAIFNAPLGGILFVVEVLFKGFEQIKLSMVIISAISAEAFIRIFYSSEQLFQLPYFTLNSAWEYPLFIILGIMIGFVGLSYIYLLYNTEKYFDKLSLFPLWVKSAAGGLLVGITGYFLPEILGTGIEVIPEVINQEFPLHYLIFIVVFKLLATAIILGSGGSGGVFAPALLLGGSIGVIYRKITAYLFEGLVSSPVIYGIAGMAALISAVFRAPLTGALIIFEMTGNYNLIIPLFLTAIIAEFVLERYSDYSIYSPELFYRKVKESKIDF